MRTVRREVLGDAHVDRAAGARTTDFTREFQELITRYAWGAIWTRPGLDRRSRSMITLTALVARGHHEELALHVRAARTQRPDRRRDQGGLLQSAIYCGVPDANTAFRIAQARARRSSTRPRSMTCMTPTPIVYDARPDARSAGSAAALAGVRPDDLAAHVRARRCWRPHARPRPGSASTRSSSATPTAPARTTATSARMAALLAGLPVSRARHDGQPAVRLAAWTPR